MGAVPDGCLDIHLCGILRRSGAVGACMSDSEVFFAVTILVLIFHGTVWYIINRVFVRRARTLEGLLGSRLRCRYWGVHSTVKMHGTYEGRVIHVTSRSGWNRMTQFALVSSILPRHKWFVTGYPRVTEDVYLANNTLVYTQYGTVLGRSSEFEESRIVPILDRLVEAANTLEQHA